MNNDLEQFSEERLMELIHESSKPEIEALARIALAAKQAKPVCYADQSDIERMKSGSTTRIGSYQTNVMSISLYTTPQPAHTEQDGWKLVPIEPTDAMQVAAANAIRFDTTAINKLWTGKRVFDAMLAAAPKPESE